MSDQINSSPFASSGKYTGHRIHLGVSGSVACYKACELLRAWLKIGIHVSVTVTPGARNFITPLLFKSLGGDPVYDEMFAGENVFAHLEPGREAEAIVVAPASANCMANLATGHAADMLSAQALAFAGPLVLAPAMNPRMWANPATKANCDILRSRGAMIVEPGSGNVACGDQGKGRLAALAEIFLTLLHALSPQDMSGLNVLVTLGPTREPWDGVRFCSNPSSGTMGAALATSAWLRGATVTAICGPGVSIFLPKAISRVNVGTARDMLAAAQKIWPHMDMGFFSAAVADFAPIRPVGADAMKIKKGEIAGNLQLEFERNPDILATLSKNRRPNQKTLGFAAEIAADTEALRPMAASKLKAKNADIIAANRINPGDSAFGAVDVSMAVVDKDGHEEIWQAQSKADIAWDLCSWLLRI